MNEQLNGLHDAAIVHRAVPIYSFMANVTQLAGDETMDLNASQFQAELALLRPQTDGAIVWGADPSSYSTTSPASWWIGMQNFAAEDANVPVPAAPSNLQIDPHGIHLTWNIPSGADAPISYTVHRSDGLDFVAPMALDASGNPLATQKW